MQIMEDVEEGYMDVTPESNPMIVKDLRRLMRMVEANARVSRSRGTPRAGATRSTQSRPRKPSAYQKWAATERKRIKKEHPRFSFGRINKELGIRWKREKRRRGMK